MRIALCDDVYYEVEDIEKYLVANGEEVDFFDHGDALLEAYEHQHQRYDAVFLDLEMKSEKEGFQIADALKSIDDTVLIVFATSHRQYVYESFRCSPVWFLCKPIEKDDLEKSLSPPAISAQPAQTNLHLQKQPPKCAPALRRNPLF